MAVQIQLRRGTASQWTSTNPTLAAGEIALETDTRKLKLGDGSTAWTSLAYFSAGSGDITGVDITAGDGLDISQSGTTSGDYTATVSADLKANGGLVIESTEIAVKLDASNITGTLAIADGGTGATAAAMIGVITAANAAAAQGVLGGTTVGKAVFVAANAAAARSAIGVGTGTGDLVAANNLSDLANAGTARSNLGLGTAALVATGTGDANAILGNDDRLDDDRDPNDHSADKVTSGTLGVDRIPALASSKITSGTLGVDRIPALSTDKLTSGTLPVGRGGTGLTSVSTLLNSNTTKSDVGLANVTNIVAQPVDAELTAIAGLTSAANKGIQFTGSGTAGVYDLTAAGKALLDDADAAAQRTTLGLGTAATTAATAYATAAQGSKADSALQDVVSDTSPQLGGNLDVQARTLTTSTSNGNVVVDPPGTGFLQVEGTTNPGKIRLMCEAGTHGVGLISPAHSTGANYDLVLPIATGSANQALKTDGSGNLGWSTLGTAAAAATGTGDSNVILGNDDRLDDDRDPNDHSAAKITSGTLAVARGGTGVTSLPMVTIPGAANAAAARTVLGVTNIGSYTGQIETVANKTYTLDPGVAADRTISGFYIKTASGTVVVHLKVGTDVVKTLTATDGTGAQHPGGFANTGVSANDVITLVCSSNSSALDVIFAVEYTE